MTDTVDRRGRERRAANVWAGRSLKRNSEWEKKRKRNWFPNDNLENDVSKYETRPSRCRRV